MLDYFPCGNLKGLLKKHSKFTEKQAQVLVAEALSDLSLLHEKYILFRDLKVNTFKFNNIYPNLKSENLLLDHEGHVRLCDFGIAKRLNPEYPYANTMCGTQE